MTADPSATSLADIFPVGAPRRAMLELTHIRKVFRVDDIETYADRVVELGGEVLDRNDYASGGNAECVDDQGFRFDLFQPAPGY